MKIEEKKALHEDNNREADKSNLMYKIGTK